MSQVASTTIASSSSLFLLSLILPPLLPYLQMSAWRGLCLCNLDLPWILTICRYNPSPSHVATYLLFFIACLLQVVTGHLVDSFRVESSINRSSLRPSIPTP